VGSNPTLSANYPGSAGVPPANPLRYAKDNHLKSFEARVTRG